jgi:hypothetical protein
VKVAIVGFVFAVALGAAYTWFSNRSAPGLALAGVPTAELAEQGIHLYEPGLPSLGIHLDDLGTEGMRLNREGIPVKEVRLAWLVKDPPRPEKRLVWIVSLESHSSGLGSSPVNRPGCEAISRWDLSFFDAGSGKWLSQTISSYFPCEPPAIPAQ